MSAFARRCVALATLAGAVACHRAPDPVTIELHMMATCPFGSHVASELSAAVAPFGDDVVLRVSHIGEVVDGVARSARGSDDVQADTLQVCADALGTGTQTRAFLACEATLQASLPAGWETCAKQAGLDITKVRECAEGSQGRELLQASFARSSAKKVSESPTLFIGAERYTGGRNRYAMAEAICGTFVERKPDACAHLPKPKEVLVRVVSDTRCKEDCDLTSFRALLEHELPGAKIQQLDFGSKEGRALFDASGRRQLPIAIFPMDWKPSGATGKQIAPHLRLISSQDGLSFAIGTRFDPLAEVCDNGKDDDGDGASDCSDARCRHQLACRSEQPNRVELLLLMGDEFSHRGVQAAHHALTKGAFDVALHPIGHTADGGLVATGGNAAVTEGVRLECAQAQGLGGEALLTYAMCRYQRPNDPNWQGCLPAEIDRGAMAECVEGERGVALLTEAYRASEQLGVQRAPYVLVNNRYPLDQHAPDAIVAALCAHNPGRTGCAKEAPR